MSCLSIDYPTSFITTDNGFKNKFQQRSVNSLPPISCSKEALRMSLDEAPMSICCQQLSSENVDTIPVSDELPCVTPEELAMELHGLKANIGENGWPLVLDCRSFVAYNASHINRAVNLSCTDRFRRKRLQNGRVSDLVSEPEWKEMLKNGSVQRAIVYDDDKNLSCSQTAVSILQLVVTSLAKEVKRISVLRGGFEGFSTLFGDLCVNNCETSCLPLNSPSTPIAVEQSIDGVTTTEILPFLYLGNESDVNDVQRMTDLGISHVLNVTGHIPFFGQFVCKRLPASDCGQQNLKQYFDDAFLFIEEAKCTGGRVLVHCQAGISRSATITISYLMRTTGMDLISAYQFVKARRSIIAPNFNFMGQLMDLEQALAKGEVQRFVDTRFSA